MTEPTLVGIGRVYRGASSESTPVGIARVYGRGHPRDSLDSRLIG